MQTVHIYHQLPFWQLCEIRLINFVTYGKYQKTTACILRGLRKQDPHCHETSLVIHPFFPSPTHESLQKGPASGWEAQLWSAIWGNVPCSLPKGVILGHSSVPQERCPLLWLQYLAHTIPSLCNTILSRWIAHLFPQTSDLPLSQHLFHCTVTYTSVFTMGSWTYGSQGLGLIVFVCPELSRCIADEWMNVFTCLGCLGMEQRLILAPGFS